MDLKQCTIILYNLFMPYLYNDQTTINIMPQQICSQQSMKIKFINWGFLENENVSSYQVTVQID